MDDNPDTVSSGLEEKVDAIPNALDSLPSPLLMQAESSLHDLKEMLQGLADDGLLMSDQIFGKVTTDAAFVELPSELALLT